MEDDKHIPLKGIDGHITWTGKEPPTAEMLYTLNQLALKGIEKFNVTKKQLEQINCKHDWKTTHSGYCSDCKKCGLKI